MNCTDTPFNLFQPLNKGTFLLLGSVSQFRQLAVNPQQTLRPTTNLGGSSELNTTPNPHLHLTAFLTCAETAMTGKESAEEEGGKQRFPPPPVEALSLNHQGNKKAQYSC